MKNLFTLISLLLLVLTGYSQAWNISTDNFKNLGTISSTTTVSGLTIYSVNSVIVDANSKTMDGFSFTYRLKLGGTGSFTDGKPTDRVVAFPVAGKTSIIVYAMSSSSTADRILRISANHPDSIIGKFNALGASIGKGEYTWNKGPATIYMYSESSGVNIYYIEAKSLTSGLNFPGNSMPYKVKTEFFSIGGTSVGLSYEMLPTGVYIRRTIFSDGSMTADKITKMIDR